jgi:hypothetical protein
VTGKAHLSCVQEVGHRSDGFTVAPARITDRKDELTQIELAAGGFFQGLFHKTRFRWVVGVFRWVVGMRRFFAALLIVLKQGGCQPDAAILRRVKNK